MAGNELTEERNRDRLKRRVRNALGPLGVFFQGFLEHPKMVASVIPSSRFTIRKMLAPVDWATCRLFVEYGPGVGTFTRPILDRLRRDGTLLVIDTNPLFIEYLRRTIGDSRFIAVHGSAEDVETIIRAHGFTHADYIASGLPFSNLPEKVADSIAAATSRAIRPGGAFMTYQFNRAATNYTARHFPRVETAYEPLNILPCKLAWGWQDEAEQG